MQIQAPGRTGPQLNQLMEQAGEGRVCLQDVCGQRYLAAGRAGFSLDIHGTPGNALGAWLDGCTIRVHGNAQDAVGDTMNSGSIRIEGMAGDAVGYAMRGGEIFVRDSAGYRCGVHMKASDRTQPLLVIGGTAGSFLGEYLAGGSILVLGIGAEDRVPVGNFCGRGMYGGRIILRTRHLPPDLSSRLTVRAPRPEEMGQLRQWVGRYCRMFDLPPLETQPEDFRIIEPDSANPYQRLYAGI